MNSNNITQEMLDKMPETVIPIVKKVRDTLLPKWGKVETIRQKDESPHNVVTELDEQVEKFLMTELASFYPDIGFAGEEFGGDREQKTFWLADPIDGTAHFIRGLPFCTTMLALINDGQVVFSIIYNFVDDIVYHAVKGGGAYKNGERIHVSERPITNTYAGCETHMEKEENREKYLKMKKFLVFMNTVSSGYEHALVAEGKLEGRICFDAWGQDYDFAPGSLLVSEAGGIVKNIGLETYDYRNTSFLAVNEALYKKLTEGDDALFPLNAN